MGEKRVQDSLYEQGEVCTRRSAGSATTTGPIHRVQYGVAQQIHISAVSPASPSHVTSTCFLTVKNGCAAPVPDTAKSKAFPVQSVLSLWLSGLISHLAVQVHGEKEESLERCCRGRSPDTLCQYRASRSTICYASTGLRAASTGLRVAPTLCQYRASRSTIRYEGGRRIRYASTGHGPAEWYDIRYASTGHGVGGG
eukprot:3244470-Rhodomonas_salina.3